MKYYKISFPGEFGQHVDEIWSEEQILKSYYTCWVGNMIQNAPEGDLAEEYCIMDWCTIHWAVEVPKPEWITETDSDMIYHDEYDAMYDPKTNEWLEGKCGDPECQMCMNRPEKPL